MSYWTTPFHSVLFWVMFEILIMMFYIFVMFVGFKEQSSRYCNVGSNKKSRRIKGALRYFSYKANSGPFVLVLITIVIFIYRILNAVFIGYYLQAAIPLPTTVDIVRFILFGSAEVALIFFYLVLYATSLDACRYIWITLLHAARIAMFIVITVQSFSGGYIVPASFMVANLAWFLVILILVICRERIHYRYRDSEYYDNEKKMGNVVTVDDQSLDVYIENYTSSPETKKNLHKRHTPDVVVTYSDTDGNEIDELVNKYALVGIHNIQNV